MRKRNFIASLALVSVLALASCTKQIPDGPVKDFMAGFDINKAYNSVDYGTSELTSMHVEDGVLLGQAKTFTQIYKKDNFYYQYSLIEIEGNYHDEEFTYDTREVLTYGDITGEVTLSQELTDGVLKELNYTTKDLEKSVKDFFYKDDKSEFHAGGMYYSDYITIKAPDLHQFFTVSEDLKTLNFNLKSLSEYNKEKVIIDQSFSVSEYGMLNNLSTKSMLYDNPEKYTLTQVSCNYDKFKLRKNLEIN